MLNQGDKYLGLRFYVGSIAYYGWMRVNFSGTFPNFTITVKDYAYENIPGTGIAAGATGGSTVVTLPLVTTITATSTTTATATLNGSINANNGATAASFEYGLTTGYGTAIAAAPSSVSGNTATPIAASLNSLMPNTTYHYRAKGVNSAGTAYGSDQSFTTAAAVATATTAAATNISANSATLNAAVNANGANTTVSFEYGLTTSYGSSAGASPSVVTGNTVTAVTASIALQQNRLYHYRVKAINAAGTTYGADLTFTSTPTSVMTASSKIEFQMYPNPATDILHITGLSGKIRIIDLFESTGKLVQRFTVPASADTYVLKTAGLPSGGYTIMLQGPARMEARQFTKINP